eukprot:11686779-Alexandrium_andersonii.AAC.1
MPRPGTRGSGRTQGQRGQAYPVRGQWGQNAGTASRRQSGASPPRGRTAGPAGAARRRPRAGARRWRRPA